MLKPIELEEEEIDAANAEELRVAYRELLGVARALRAMISARTGKAVAGLRERGFKFNGNLPYGLDSDEETKKIEPSRYEQRLIAEIKKLHAAGLSLQAIARTLEANFANRAGNAIDAKQVARILDAAGVDRKRRQVIERQTP
jgi:DNA invertase Pin-like site-specific DNA recombinase